MINIKKHLYFFKNKATLLVIFYSFLLLLVGCKMRYSLSGASIPPEAKSISVQYFQNQAALSPPNLSQLFTEALRDRLSNQSHLSLISKNGDLAFEGTIISYTIAPIAIQSNDQAALTRLTISVSVKYTCSFDEKKNFEQTFSRYSDFPNTKTLSSVQNELITLINEQLTQDIYNRALNDW
ncbi:MAG: LptE family protein [Bacteroidia bacterium]